jgi:hypothetical protein
VRPAISVQARAGIWRAEVRDLEFSEAKELDSRAKGELSLSTLSTGRSLVH